MLAAVVTAMLCMCCVGVVAMDDGVDAVPGPVGSVDNPIVLSSEELNSDVGTFVSKYDVYSDGSYFAVDYGTYVNFYSLPGDEYSVSINRGSLSSSVDDPSFGSIVYGTATEDFYLLFVAPAGYFNWHFIVSDPPFDFTSPDAIEAISNSTISYTAATNIPATFAEVGGTAASWLDIDQTTGQISGTAPDVDAETTYTYEIQATSTDNQSNTATMTLTITVYPALEIGDQFTVGELIYEVIQEGEVGVANTTSTSITGNLVIPETVPYGPTTYNVTSIGDDAFENCSGLTSITTAESVTSIGNRAFYDCSGLESVTIPEGVTSIGDEAFNGCTVLASINIPEGVTSISYGAFANCSGLESINIPGSVTSIRDYAFAYCSGLESINILEGVTSIDTWAFMECSSLTSLTIPDSVTSIGDCAFGLCSSLTSLTIPDSVTSIGTYAFGICSALTTVTFESMTAPTFGMASFVTGTIINVYTPGWDPTLVMTGDVITSPTPDQVPSSTVVWANAPLVYPDLTFKSDPVADGIIAWVSTRT